MVICNETYLLHYSFYSFDMFDEISMKFRWKGSLCPCEGHWVGCIFRSALRWNRNWEPILSNPTDVDYGISDLIGLLCESMASSAVASLHMCLPPACPILSQTFLDCSCPGMRLGHYLHPHDIKSRYVSKSVINFCLPSASGHPKSQCTRPPHQRWVRLHNPEARGLIVWHKKVA